MADFLPWQRELASAWLAETERFAHAWLIHGLPGIGKRSFALAAARALLCEQKRGGTACGECQACRWMAAGNHPDFRRVRPDAVAQAEGEINEETAASAKSSPSKEIRIEQVRNLAGWFGTATHRGGWRVAVIYPAHAMNLYTANALLKVLEEPPPNTVFLLTADAPDRLLPTIVSRCRRLPLAIPSEETAVHWLADLGVETPHAWLAAAGGAPLRALQSAKEGGAPCPNWLQDFLRGLSAGPGLADRTMLSTADALSGMEPAIWLDALQKAFFDLSLVQVAAAPRYYPSQQPVLQRIVAHTAPGTLNELFGWLSEQRAIAGHPLSAGLFVHSVLQRCVQACAQETPSARS